MRRLSTRHPRNTATLPEPQAGMVVAEALGSPLPGWHRPEFDVCGVVTSRNHLRVDRPPGLAEFVDMRGCLRLWESRPSPAAGLHRRADQIGKSLRKPCSEQAESAALSTITQRPSHAERTIGLIRRRYHLGPTALCLQQPRKRQRCR